MITITMQCDPEGDYVGKTLNTIFVDMMFKYQGLSIMYEFADKKADGDDPFAYDVDGSVIGSFYTGSAHNIQMGYMLPSNIEFAARYTEVSADASRDEKHYTFGLNKFFVGHKLKLQTDFSLIKRDGSQNSALWRTQVDIHF